MSACARLCRATDNDRALAAIVSQQIGPGRSYFCHPDHRNGNFNKSQWTISVSGEVQCFTVSNSEGWLNGAHGWGLYDIPGGAIDYVGTATDGKSQLLIAKFVTGGGKGLWHGYPADHRNAEDRPETGILDEWLQRRMLRPAVLSKIARGALCHP